MKVLAYRLNRKIRNCIMYVMRVLAPEWKRYDPDDILDQAIHKILLVRATFRIGASVLATPAISMFRRRFPNARIDFVGGPISKVLFENLPIDNHYSIKRRFPFACWSYLALLRNIRKVRYDLAVELSCSQSAMGAFIVGFSGSRFRAGRTGKRDFWFNVKIPRPMETSKYHLLSTFLSSMGLQPRVFPSVVLSSVEKAAGQTTIAGGTRFEGPLLGVFIGARKAWGKRWPKECFLELINDLHAHGLRVIVFAGPEEKNLLEFYRDRVARDVRFGFERDLRTFAALLSNCRLFVTCDTGPMHLACALGVYTIAIFQKPNFHRWGPPSDLGRVLYNPEGVLPRDVVRVCVQDLVRLGFYSAPEHSLTEIAPAERDYV
jgi:heptosyltransferase-3